MNDTAWRDLVDLERLAGWMDEAGIESGPILDPRALPGGTQNLLLHFRRGERPFVLRRPPRHPHADGNETMRREARVLAALATTDVPHPKLIAACSREDVLGSAFYLMEPVDGFNATRALPPLHAADPNVRRRMGFSLVDGIARLARLDPAALGLAGFGKVDGYLTRQVGRWQRLLAGYAEYEGWRGPEGIPGVATVGEWLAQRVPAHFTPGIVHGDYHLANVLFRYDGPELAAIVDWELSTLGDPLLDLGWLLATWRDDTGFPVGDLRVEPWEGFPTGDELIERYARHSGRDVSAIRWYVVLAGYKLGIILEGTYARACAGKAAMSTGEQLHESAVRLLERASLNAAR